jgi:hypothetical protein
LDLIYNVRLSISDDWKPTLKEFKEIFKVHGVIADAELEYKKLYGNSNSKIGGDSPEAKSLQPEKKDSRTNK